MSSARLRSRRGSTLLMVILVTAILAISLTAVYSLNSAELRVNTDHREQLEAFALAESGREQYLAARAVFTNTPPPAYDSTRFDLPNGYADVVMRLIRPSVGTAPAVYLLESHAVKTTVLNKGALPAERTVGQYLYWNKGSLNVLAGWTSLSGLHKNGNAGTLSGVDAGTCPGSPLPNVAGVAVPTSPGYTGQTGPASGSPPIRDLGPPGTADDSVNIDWAAIVDGTAPMTPTVTIPGQAWPSFTDPNYWPIIKVNGDFSLPGDGRGVLIVTGGLTMSGNARWDGVLMVGNNLTSNGNNSVVGAVVTGLNVKLGMAVPQASLGNGQKTFRFNSCNVANAMSRMSTLLPYANAWMDNWASW